jgi:hypothetical protein
MQARQYDLQGFGGRLQSLLSYPLGNPVDKFRQSFDHPSAQDQATGVKGINQAHGSSSEGLRCFVDNMERQGISFLGCLGNDFGRHRFQFSPGYLQHGSASIWIRRNQFLGVLGNGPATCQSFQAAPVSTSTGRAVQVNGYMTKLTPAVTAAG